ncbi:hypothetical protein [uncultured Tolumonas sp.]|uniref:hypothetical protein n=1 Tax=uncultured Tolumonas sp. TaxID=263765 RepID=UPI002A0A952C|nr:hypothetical protein [uncultured Tolumonas sp.]
MSKVEIFQGVADQIRTRKRYVLVAGNYQRLLSHELRGKPAPYWLAFRNDYTRHRGIHAGLMNFPSQTQ